MTATTSACRPAERASGYRWSITRTPRTPSRLPASALSRRAGAVAVRRGSFFGAEEDAVEFLALAAAGGALRAGFAELRGGLRQRHLGVKLFLGYPPGRFFFFHFQERFGFGGML